MTFQSFYTLPQKKRALLLGANTNPSMYLSIDHFMYNYQKDAFFYSIEIGIKKGSSIEIHTVEKRYSALLQFDKQIRPMYQDFESLLEFPPKKYFGNKNPSFLQQRKESLEIYLGNLNKLPEINSKTVFLDFFELNPFDFYIKKI